MKRLILVDAFSLFHASKSIKTLIEECEKKLNLHEKASNQRRVERSKVRRNLFISSDFMKELKQVLLNDQVEDKIFAE